MEYLIEYHLYLLYRILYRMHYRMSYKIVTKMPPRIPYRMPYIMASIYLIYLTYTLHNTIWKILDGILVLMVLPRMLHMIFKVYIGVSCKVRYRLFPQISDFFQLKFAIE